MSVSSSKNYRTTNGMRERNILNENGREANGGIVYSLQQWKLLSSLVKIKRDPLLLEEQQLVQETHPAFVNQIALCIDRYEREMKLIEMAEEHETARIEIAYDQQIKTLENEYKCRLNELTDILLHELEENKRQLDGEIIALEIARKDGGFNTGANLVTGSNFSTAQINQWSIQSGHQGITSKKQLRRRPNEITNNIASTSGAGSIADSNAIGGIVEKKGRKRSPGAVQSCPLITQTLLPAQAIAEDVEKYCSSINMEHNSSSSFSLRNVNSSRMVNDMNTISNIHNRIDGDDNENEDRDEQQQRLSKVHLEQGKLLCDGKTFLRGQTVFLKSTNTGWFMPATVMQINELTVQFRSTIPGDTRTVTATKEDLECRRVIVRKRH